MIIGVDTTFVSTVTRQVKLGALRSVGITLNIGSNIDVKNDSFIDVIHKYRYEF